LAVVITELMKFTEGNHEKKTGWGCFEGTFQTLVMIKDIAVHNMRHTQCGQFLLFGYAFWISVTIK
jgi:hypothetical protein